MKIIILLFIVFLVLVFIYFIYQKKSKTSGFYKFEAFEQTVSNLHNLKADLLALLNKTLSNNATSVYQNTVGYLDEYRIMDCVGKTMIKYNIPFELFNMDGEKMNDPIIKMYDENPKLYKALNDCKFLTLTGRIVSMAAWVTYSGKKKDIQTFSDSLKTIDFGDIEIWKTISNPEGTVMKTVKM